MATEMGRLLDQLGGLLDLERKRFAIEAPSRRGQFTAYASTYGNVDRQGDIVERGAFDECLRTKREFPLLWQHHGDVPLGVVRAQSDPRGLRVLGQLDLNVENAREAYSLMTTPEGFETAPLRELSIGYVVEDEEQRGAVRHLKKLALHEVSLVTIAANPLATVLDVKSAGDDNELSGADVCALLDFKDYLEAHARMLPIRLAEIRLKAALEVEAARAWRGRL